jgi:hypothetical protein
LFKQSDVNQWFKGFDKAFSNLDRSIDTAGDNLEKHLKQRTDSLTPTLSRALINSRRFEQSLTEDSFELVLSYNSDGSAPYAIEQHEGAPNRSNPYYRHDYPHNPAEAQTFTGQVPLRYLAIPLIQEREEWWKKVFSKIGWK